MDQLGLFGLAGFEGFEDLMPAVTPIEEKKTEKKSAKKAEKKSAKKAGKVNTGADVDVTLPVEVYGRGFHLTVTGSGTKKGVDVLDTLVNENAIHELKVKGMKATYVAALNAIYLCDEQVKETSLEAQVQLPVTVADGGVSATYEEEHFNVGEDDVTLADVLKLWVESNPDYEGCKLSYNTETSVAYPIWGAKTADDFSAVSFGGDTYQLEPDEDAKNASAIIARVFGQAFPLSAEFVGKDSVYLSFKPDSNSFYLKDAAGFVQNKMAEVKYNLPMNVFVATWGETYSLQPAHFDGKTSVKLEEVKSKLAELYPVCACLLDTNRKVDAVYLKDLNKLSLMLISGTKGAAVTATPSSLQKFIASAKELSDIVSTAEIFHGVYCPEDGGHMKVDVFPFGVFKGTYGKAKDCCTVERLDFERRLPKIPYQCLETIVRYFRTQLPNEAIVKVMYNKANGEFYFIKGTGDATGDRIHYSFDMNDFLLPETISVMEIHSHGYNHASFSWVDNEDEKGIPGVYGVIGNVDSDHPTMLFRAGLDGMFTRVAWFDLFG